MTTFIIVVTALVIAAIIGLVIIAHRLINGLSTHDDERTP
jgi:preprotein translocase subunit SecG